MNNINQENFSLKKEYIFLALLYLSLIIGFIFGENSSGGAYLDYLNQKTISENFANNFFYSLLNYDDFTTRHSPILIIILSFLEKIQLSDFSIRLTYLHLNLFLPFIFYLILKLKYQNIEQKYFFLIIGLIFLSPTFRSLSIWPDSRLLGLTIFSLSIFYYLKFKNEKKFYFVVLNIIFCATSSYISPNFSVFAIYYFYKFWKYYGINNKRLYLIFLLNILLSLPAFYYIFVFDINFLLKSASPGFQNNNILFLNYLNQLIIIPSIIFFYIFPFLFTKILNLKNKINIKILLGSFIIFIFCFIFFNYKLEFTGGGIFFKFSNYFFGNNILFFAVGIISIILVFNIIYLDLNNFFLLFLLILSNPQITIYHKYYDPFLIILFFSLFNFNVRMENYKKNTNIIIIYLYFICFLILNLYKYLWKI